MININPIRRGGFLSDKVREYTSQFLDGYSVCDYCKGDLEKIQRPPFDTIEGILTKQYGLDRVMITFGAREAMGIVTKALLKPNDIVVVDQNRHYSSVLATEVVGATIIEAETNGYPEYKVLPENYEIKIQEVIKRTGNKPKLLLLTHVDGRWGNVADAKEVGMIAQRYDIPLLLNAAYSAGRFRFKANEIGADFVAISGHKSFGSSGPIGALLYKSKWEGELNIMSELYPLKRICTLGCTARGTAMPSFYMALQELDQRLDNWEKEIEKTRYFVQKMEEIGKGRIKQLGRKPKDHDLVYFETPILYEISEKKKEKGYFLAKVLYKREIMGVQEGKSKGFKVSVYGLKNDEIEYVINSFKEIINEG